MLRVMNRPALRRGGGRKHMDDDGPTTPKEREWIDKITVELERDSGGKDMLMLLTRAIRFGIRRGRALGPAPRKRR